MRRQPDTGPWYRQFYPWLLVAIPVAGVVMASITTVVALSTADVEVRRADAPPLEKTSWEYREDGR